MAEENEAEKVVENVIDNAANKAASETAAAVSAEATRKDVEANTTKTAAEAATALANANAAATKADAVERERGFIERVAEWQARTSTEMEEQKATLRSIGEGMTALSSTLSLAMERLSSIPQKPPEIVKEEITEIPKEGSDGAEGQKEAKTPPPKRGRRFI